MTKRTPEEIAAYLSGLFNNAVTAVKAVQSELPDDGIFTKEDVVGLFSDRLSFTLAVIKEAGHNAVQLAADMGMVLDIEEVAEGMQISVYEVSFHDR